MMPLRGVGLTTTVVLFCLAALTGCTGKTNKTEFSLLYGNAMTIEYGRPETEVIELLGKPKEIIKGKSGTGKVLSYYSGSPIDNNIMIIITDGKVTGGMAMKDGNGTTFARDATHSTPAKGGRPKAPPAASAP